MEPDATLDQQDRILIGLLQNNARASYQELAEAAGMSPSTVRRRVDRLMESSCLKLVAVPDWPRFGIYFSALIAISVDLPQLRNVGSDLAKMDEICWVAIATGAFDLFAQVVLPMNADFVRFITQRIAPIQGIQDIQTFMVPEFVKSFEQYRLPASPDPLYLRGGDGRYAFDESQAAAD